MNGIVTFQVMLLQFGADKLYLYNISLDKLAFVVPIR